jgi:hypothetical protein
VALGLMVLGREFSHCLRGDTLVRRREAFRRLRLVKMSRAVGDFQA